MMGCNRDPPADVAHLQFKSRIAFKLVWVPPTFDTFVLVDDDGNLLARGSPTGHLPHMQQRQMNYRAVADSKYSVQADIVGRRATAKTVASPTARTVGAPSDGVLR